MAYTPGDLALPNPSPGSGNVKDVDGKPAAPMPTAPNPGPAAPKPPEVVEATATEALSNQKSSASSQRYPGDIGEQDTDYMIFDFYDYVAPFSSADYAGTSLSQYNKSSTALTTPAKDYNQIILYMPEGVSASYKANWDGKKFGNIAAGVLAASGGFASGNFKDFFDKLGTTSVEAAKRIPAQVGAGAISAIIGGITGDSVGANDIFSAVGGQILNPNAELIFGGHDLRTFTFSYKLVPYNEEEAKIIFGPKGIIATFKRAMLPSFAGSKIGDSGKYFSAADKGKDSPVGFIKNPKLVQVTFMHKTSPHPYLPRFKPCTITDFDVNYTADGVYAAHDKGYPAAAEINISLMETKLIYAEDIPNGF